MNKGSWVQNEKDVITILEATYRFYIIFIVPKVSPQ